MSHGSLDERGGFVDVFDASTPISGRDDQKKARAFFVSADLVLQPFAAAIEQPNHVNYASISVRRAQKAAAPSRPADGFRISFTDMLLTNESRGAFA